MKSFARWLVVCALAFVLLQLFFVLRIAAMAWIAPQSTAFQRSEIWRIASENHRLPWDQEWVPYEQISPHLKRAVIASEDDAFASHDGVDWDALQKARERNAKAEARAEQRAIQSKDGKPPKPPKIIGGSTITQQLAKNLLLSGERTLIRKGQELVLTLLLEHLLDKRRILEIYLNNVEWGEGVFGAQAAAQHYYRKPAAKLNAYEAARLAVMLPRPRYFEKNLGSAYLSNRASVIVARMPDAELP
ncbi:monofunctional biosynthetic peptidoglycan transglycosylase [Curvibacter sp. CHRR-16]|uniref:monofunctional biosynthetic peptidoglycan transglycosylase n=1 Tax=Curvibacter sp. CHRR-16 TaxID=2835872 RepID=UPI001BD9F1DC|nr:monofunctional biosynthetic peptidoglycan transglycosylase [Curvibacter sp. CHRR-16]MBT0569955.1 monofunctional biosynthetic peptidoglycan transglycosylase [Curvibacter sp. CHRR-16]